MIYLLILILNSFNYILIITYFISCHLQISETIRLNTGPNRINNKSCQLSNNIRIFSIHEYIYITPIVVCTNNRKTDVNSQI